MVFNCPSTDNGSTGCIAEDDALIAEDVVLIADVVAVTADVVAYSEGFGFCVESAHPVRIILISNRDREKKVFGFFIIVYSSLWIKTANLKCDFRFAVL